MPRITMPLVTPELRKPRSCTVTPAIVRNASMESLMLARSSVSPVTAEMLNGISCTV